MVIYLSGIHNETDEQSVCSLKSLLFGLGCTVIIPEEDELIKLSWTESLSQRLSFILASDTIYMLPDWKESTIARIELTAAMNEKVPLCFTMDDIKELITTLDN